LTNTGTLKLDLSAATGVTAIAGPIGTGAQTILGSAGVDAITFNASVNLSGTVNTGTGADTIVLPTSATTNALTLTDSDGVTVTAGSSGVDTITLGASTTATINGFSGASTAADTLVVPSGSIANLNFTGATPSWSPTIATTNAGTINIVDTGTGASTIDLSLATANTGTININASGVTSTPSATIKGAAGTGTTGVTNIIATTGADTLAAGLAGGSITGGDGKDAITAGAGTDKIVYTAISVTQSGSAVGATATTAPVSTNADTVATFLAGTDKIVLPVAFGAVGASGTLIPTGGTAYTTSSTTLASGDFVTCVIGATSSAVTADTAGTGRFLFDTTNKVLIFDPSGDSAISTAGAYTAGAADDFVVIVTTGVTITAADFIFA
jgi:hypothetical protein